jgi:hypothetical protein
MSDKIVLFGDACSGKTVCSVSALKGKPDSRLIYLITENNSLPSIHKGLELHKISPKEGQVIYAYPKQPKGNFINLTRSLESFQKSSFVENVKGNVATTQNKEKYGHLINILKNLEAFSGTCIQTDKEIKLGSVDNFKETDILVVDGLSAIVQEVWACNQGDKLAISQSDYGGVQLIMGKIMYAIANIPCGLILLAHEKPYYEGDNLTLSAGINFGAGSATYQSLIGNFSEVIHTYKLGTSFKMETNKPKVTGANRKIPAATNLEQDLSKYGLFE